MKSTGLVFSMRQYLGSAEPPATILEDESRYGSDGAFKADGQPDWVKTPKGIWVMDFNTANPDWIEIPADQTQLDFTSGDFSIIVRARFDSLAGYPFLFNKGAWQVDGYWFRVRNTGQIEFSTHQTGADQSTLSADGAALIDTWYTLGMSRKGEDASVYKDGVDATVTSGTHINPETSDRAGLIGIDEDKASYPHDGRIALLDIYNYALAAEQHAAIHDKLKQWG